MLPENVQSFHEGEERIRAQSLEFIEREPVLAEHLGLIHDALYVLIHFCREHRHQNDDELALQLLGIRLFNDGAASLKLVLSGYYQPAYHHVRDLLEVANLLDYFRNEPAKIAEWRAADDKGDRAFLPVKVREALDAHAEYAGTRRNMPYKRLSTYAAHPTFRGFRLITNDNLIQVGPYFDAGILRDWLLETAAWLGYATMTFAEHFKQLSPELATERSVLAKAAVAWHSKYLAAPPKP